MNGYLRLNEVDSINSPLHIRFCTGFLRRTYASLMLIVCLRGFLMFAQHAVKTVRTTDRKCLLQNSISDENILPIRGT